MATNIPHDVLLSVPWIRLNLPMLGDTFRLYYDWPTDHELASRMKQKTGGTIQRNLTGKLRRSDHGGGKCHRHNRIILWPRPPLDPRLVPHKYRIGGTRLKNFSITLMIDAN